jgi:hypothetical protein
MNLYEIHEKMTGHLFPAYSNTDDPGRGKRRIM